MPDRPVESESAAGIPEQLDCSLRQPGRQKSRRFCRAPASRGALHLPRFFPLRPQTPGIQAGSRSPQVLRSLVLVPASFSSGGPPRPLGMLPSSRRLASLCLRTAPADNECRCGPPLGAALLVLRPTTLSPRRLYMMALHPSWLLLCLSLASLG